ncbi:hypothetical protein LOK49_LG08G01881 [Camellia lanceoleosa]|uniref:Uncharacterized protein n=1 Tax=Camellia lanceoleosa TaxID=1840588 RepID=A0ACC0GRP9_9ERIC|nr:hypothetical protein LOK49_LG08G01881 [Camellia lanceoleosa]
MFKKTVTPQQIYIRMTSREVLNRRVSHTKYKTVSSSYKKKKSSIIPSLPEQVILCILVWLPIDILYNSMSFPFPNEVLVTCDGLVLLSDERDKTIHVTNPLTKQSIPVPSLNSLLYGCCYSFAHVQSTGEYKVVCSYSFTNKFTVLNCAIPTLVAWVNNGAVVVFVVKPGPYVAYNVEIGKTFAFGSYRDEGLNLWCDNAYGLVSLTSS